MKEGVIMKKIILMSLFASASLAAMASANPHQAKPKLCNEVAVKITEEDPNNLYTLTNTTGKFDGSPSSTLENSSTEFGVCPNSSVTYQATDGANYIFTINGNWAHYSCQLYFDNNGPDKAQISLCRTEIVDNIAHFVICDYRTCNPNQRLA